LTVPTKKDTIKTDIISQKTRNFIKGRNTLMKEQLIARANECFDRYIDKYYQNGRFERADFWDTAEIFEIIDDAYEITGDKKYADYIEEVYTAFVSQHGNVWEGNIYNDDIMWGIIAMARAYQLTGIKKYYETAKANLDYVWPRSMSDDLGGGLWWRIDNQSKNACVNCPGVIAACLIGEISGDESYFEKAKDVMEWTVKTLAEEEIGKVSETDLDAYVKANHKGYEIKSSEIIELYNKSSFIIGYSILLNIEKDGKEKEVYVNPEKVVENDELSDEARNTEE